MSSWVVAATVAGIAAVAASVVGIATLVIAVRAQRKAARRQEVTGPWYEVARLSSRSVGVEHIKPGRRRSASRSPSGETHSATLHVESVGGSVRVTYRLEGSPKEVLEHHLSQDLIAMSRALEEAGVHVAASEEGKTEDTE